jgi:predicted protein tyrosine phosphatase
MKPDDKIVCICRGGQVRSVAARHILADRYGFKKVLSCGWEKNDSDTVQMLCDWADYILIVGSTMHWRFSTPLPKTKLIDIGPDIWGSYNHPDLLAKLESKIKELLC